MASREKINIDPASFFKDVKGGLTLGDLQKKYEIKSPTRVYSTYVTVLVQLGIVPPLGGSPGRKTATNQRNLKKRKSGSVVIPQDVLEKLGGGADEYQLKVTSKGLIIRPVEEEPAGEARPID